MKPNGKNISYLRSINPETRFVPEVIKDLDNDLKSSSFSEDDILEIILASDEALTNAILESAKAIDRKDKKAKETLLSEYDITVSWTISQERFSFTVVDQGGGFDLGYMLERLPSPNRKNYLEEVNKYQKKNNLTLRINGEPTEVKRFGAGLKIIMSFMDKITIDYINKDQVISKELSQKTQGTILNMIRFRNRRNNN